jgi:hypothetical protein
LILPIDPSRLSTYPAPRCYYARHDVVGLHPILQVRLDRSLDWPGRLYCLHVDWALNAFVAKRRLAPSETGSDIEFVI